MKKWTGWFLCLIFILTVVGCGKNSTSGRTENQPAGVNDVLEVGMAKEDSQNESNRQNVESVADSTNNEPQRAGNEDVPKSEPINESVMDSGNTEKIDVDLTALSSTMVYSEVYNMMVSPENYIGKNVKMNGMFNFYHDEATDKDYFACIIADATACCSQGIEFVLTDDYTYPDDYPEDGGEICVIGVFDTYQEGSYTYCILRNARLA